MFYNNFMKITLVMAVTLDGKIAKNKNHFPDWTSKEDKKFFAKISKEHGVVLMGENTFNTFKKPLKDRLNVVFTHKKNLPEMENVMWVSGEIKNVLKDLENRKYGSAVLAGGAILNGVFLKEKLIDEIIVTINPKIFGSGISLFDGDFDIDLKLIKLENINEDTIVVYYKPIFNN